MNDLMVTYRLAMRRRGLAAGSIDRRLAVARWWLEAVPDWQHATRRDVERWVDGRPVGPRTRYLMLSSLHMFYLWARREELAEHDPTELVERPRLPRRLPRPMRSPAYRLARETAGPQLGAMLDCMALAGLRCVEVANLRWNDVDLMGRSMIVRGKGDQERKVGTSQDLARSLWALDGGTGHVFRGRAGAPLKPARVSQIVNRHLHALGIEDSAHSLRHRYASELYRESHGDLLLVRDQLGHADVATTQIYARIDDDAAAVAARLMDAAAKRL